MKVSLMPAVGGTVTVKTKDGQTFTTEHIESIEFTPFFSMANGHAEAVIGESKSETGVSHDKFILTASGANGKVKRINARTEKSVVPMIDRPKKSALPPESPTPEIKTDKKEGTRK